MKKKTLFWIALAFTPAIFVAIIIIDKHLQTDAAPCGIVSFECAKTLDQSILMLNSWDAEAKVYAALSLGIDYLYLLAYGSFLSLSILLLASKLPPGFLKKWAKIAALMIVLAALLDAVENYALIQLLTDVPSQSMTSLAYYCAAVKFSLIGVGIFYLLAVLIFLGIKKVN